MSDHETTEKSFSDDKPQAIEAVQQPVNDASPDQTPDQAIIKSLSEKSEVPLAKDQIPLQKTSQKPDVYKIGAGRQIVLWILFILFLPFFLSMPIMIFMRATTGHATDAISLSLIFALSAIAMFFIILQIAAVGRTRVELHDDRIGMRLPTWRGPNPFGPVTTTRVPYNNISAIEARGELYTFMGVLGLREVTSVVTKDGKRHVIGYITENEDDSPIPVDRISKNLSERIAMPITHKGAVHAGTQLGAMFKGAPSWDAAPIDKTQVDKIRKRASYISALFITGFFVLLAAGIGLTLYPDLLKFSSSPSENVKPASVQGSQGKTR